MNVTDEPKPSRRPNVLFLMSDEHRADVAGFAGDPVVRTPVLDALAASGTVFDNAYTPSPICIPARQCLMTGQYPRTCGCEVFGEDIAPGSMTWARRFAQYGYAAVVAGKLHHLGPDQMQGWTRRVAPDAVVADRYIEGAVAAELARYAVPPGGGQKWSDAKEVLRAGVGRSPHVVADEDTITGTLHFIEEYFSSPFYDREQGHRPLLLKVSLLQPHYPYLTDADRFAYYLNRVTPYRDEPVFDHPFLKQRQVRPGIDVSERDLRRATAAYYGMVENLDALFGQILDALRAAGQDLDEWVIVYTSDHGEMLGQHGIWEKQKFFEGSARVPLLVRWPSGLPNAPARVGRNVSLCDLFATLCDLTGLPTPPDRESRSLVPLLSGGDAEWDDEVLSFFGRNNVMIKCGPLKYQYYGPDMPEVLFDLERDPSERVNFVEDGRYGAALDRFRRRLQTLERPS